MIICFSTKCVKKLEKEKQFCFLQTERTLRMFQARRILNSDSELSKKLLKLDGSERKFAYHPFVV